MKIIDGKDTVLGRLASYAAKEALKGEEITILNCEQVIISGNKKDIQGKFKEKRSKVGTGQQGPKYSRNIDKIVKRTIRGMIPDHRLGRGKEALKRIRCYVSIPKEFADKEKMKIKSKKQIKFLRVGEIYGK
jgi:large subunit ribosomal protein L13